MNISLNVEWRKTAVFAVRILIVCVIIVQSSYLAVGQSLLLLLLMLLWISHSTHFHRWNTVSFSFTRPHSRSIVYVSYSPHSTPDDFFAWHYTLDTKYSIRSISSAQLISMDFFFHSCVLFSIVLLWTENYYYLLLMIMITVIWILNFILCARLFWRLNHSSHGKIDYCSVQMTHIFFRCLLSVYLNKTEIVLDVAHSYSVDQLHSHCFSI